MSNFGLNTEFLPFSKTCYDVGLRMSYTIARNILRYLCQHDDRHDNNNIMFIFSRDFGEVYANPTSLNMVSHARG